jgi:hypothetical protein
VFRVRKRRTASATISLLNKIDSTTARLYQRDLAVSTCSQRAHAFPANLKIVASSEEHLASLEEERKSLPYRTASLWHLQAVQQQRQRQRHVSIQRVHGYLRRGLCFQRNAESSPATRNQLNERKFQLRSPPVQRHDLCDSVVATTDRFMGCRLFGHSIGTNTTLLDNKLKQSERNPDHWGTVLAIWNDLRGSFLVATISHDQVARRESRILAEHTSFSPVLRSLVSPSPGQRAPKPSRGSMARPFANEASMGICLDLGIYVLNRTDNKGIA